VIAPLISRAQVFHLIPPTKKDVARRLAEILNIEGVKYDVKTVAQLVNTYYPDARKIINTAQLQTRDNVLTVSVDELIGADLQMKVVDVLSSNLPMKDKIADIRKLLAEHQVHDYVPYYQLLYQHVDIYAGDKIPQAIIAIAEGQFRDGQVPDREINFMATLYTILTS
jgi:DNA polymerase III gamma/tau subunit